MAAAFGEAVPAAAMRDELQRGQVYAFEIDKRQLPDIGAPRQPFAAEEPGKGRCLRWRPRSPGNLVPRGWGCSGGYARVAGAPCAPAAGHRLRAVYDRSGRLVAQHDGALGQNNAPVNYVPFASWSAGDRIRDMHVISLAASLPGETVTR